MKIRNATEQDISKLQAFQKHLSEFEAKFSGEFNVEWAYSEKGNEYFHNLVSSPEAIGLVAEEKGKLIGYAAVTIKDTTFRKRDKLALLDHLFVNESYRGKGVGTELIKELKSRLKERNVPRLQLFVLKDNTEAVKFYELNGLKEFISVMEADI